MQYLLLVYVDERADAGLPAVELARRWRGYERLTEDLIDGGAFVSAAALESTETATTVQVRDESTTTADGPSLEGPKQLAGYYRVECADLDEAIVLAARIPDASTGSVEIRPVMDVMPGR